jgi:cytochrome c oxidase assembly protein subunit 15
MNAAAAQPLVDFSPLLRMGLLVAVIALLPLGYVWLRQRGHDTGARLAALTALTLFLTFDLIAFGAFTRLTDSGLGCPDWPGCYGEASPIGAHDDIHAAHTAAPGGPVSFTKAWIEMIHRYLAMTVGVLLLVMTAVAWRERQRLPISPWWPTLTLAWVLVQGLFGKYTVTLKLYPLVVTLHLLGGAVLLMLLAVQHAMYRRSPLVLPGRLRGAAGTVLAVWLLQMALGGWVSSNYAVLACVGFPQCNGQWWPAADFGTGFTLLRALGEGVGGGGLTHDALVAIHLAHRAFAVVAALAAATLAWALWKQGEDTVRRFGIAVALLLLAQLASGLSNVVLGWPLPAALAHSAGAAGMVLTLTLLLTRSGRRWPQLRVQPLAARSAA